MSHNADPLPPRPPHPAGSGTRMLPVGLTHARKVLKHVFSQEEDRRIIPLQTGAIIGRKRKHIRRTATYLATIRWEMKNRNAAF